MFSSFFLSIHTSPPGALFQVHTWTRTYDNMGHTKKETSICHNFLCKSHVRHLNVLLQKLCPNQMSPPPPYLIMACDKHLLYYSISESWKVLHASKCITLAKNKKHINRFHTSHSSYLKYWSTSINMINQSRMMKNTHNLLMTGKYWHLQYRQTERKALPNFDV